jgi:hypothetical protein
MRKLGLNVADGFKQREARCSLKTEDEDEDSIIERILLEEEDEDEDEDADADEDEDEDEDGDEGKENGKFIATGALVAAGGAPVAAAGAPVAAGGAPVVGLYLRGAPIFPSAWPSTSQPRTRRTLVPAASSRRSALSVTRITVCILIRRPATRWASGAASSPTEKCAPSDTTRRKKRRAPAGPPDTLTLPCS